jgi:hypothetical protein
VGQDIIVRENDSLMANEDILSPVMDLAVAKKRLQEFQLFVKDYLVEGEDFGTIPGTPKPTLLKPGADKLCELYGLGDSYDIVDKVEEYSAHPPLFDYTIRCTLVRLRTGQVVSTGLGSCSTYESRYRYRSGKRMCPQCGSDAIIKGKAEYGGGWVCFTKKNGCGAKFKDDDKSITGQVTDRIENPDIVDQKNTVLKMAKKRAKIDATLSATRSSGIFTQDIEDMDVGDGKVTMTQPPKKQATKQAPTEDVKCAQCGAINGHLPDCPTRQKSESKPQQEGTVIPPDTKTMKGWMYVDKVTDRETRKVAATKDRKASGGNPYQVWDVTSRGTAKKYQLNVFHGTLHKNSELVVGTWIEGEVISKVTGDKTLYTLDKVLASEDENGITPWRDNEPFEEDLSKHGISAEEIGI